MLIVWSIDRIRYFLANLELSSVHDTIGFDDVSNALCLTVQSYLVEMFLHSLFHTKGANETSQLICITSKYPSEKSACCFDEN